jgi:3-oxoacyl-[acyl-carrier protein] reductase
MCFLQSFGVDFMEAFFDFPRDWSLPMDLKLKGRRALVVAASSGLGRACAESLAREGANVAICSREKQRIWAAAKRILDAAGTPVVPLVADISDSGQVAALADEVRQKLGGADILVTNSGGPPPGDFSELSRVDWEDGIQGTLISVLELCRAFLPGMAAQGWGRVVMIASASARQPIDGLIVSNTLRAGLLGLVRSLAREYTPHGVLINAVLPGYMATERLLAFARKRASAEEKSLESIQAEWNKNIPIGRIGDPSELGNAVAFLCSEAASYITGSALSVDGGITRGLP